MSVHSDTGPFAIVPEWLLVSGASDRAVRLYGILARHADNESGKTHPSRRTLAGWMSCSVDSVDRARSELEAMGALTAAPRRRDDGSQSSNEYRIARVRPRGVGTAAQGREHSSGTNELDLSNEKDLPTSLPLDGGAVAPPEPPAKPRARNEWFDALAEVFPAATKGEQSRVGMVAAELKRLTPPPEPELVRAVARWVREEWPNATVMAVSKNWSLGVERVGGSSAVRNPAARRFWEEPGG